MDAGKTWQLMGLEKTRAIHRIIVHPDDPNTVFVGAIGSPWGTQEDRGVYKTTDGGKTWKKILYMDNKTGVGEMIMDPNNPNKIFVNMWEHRRYPWFFESGGASSGLYVTQDGGDNWKKLSAEENGLPKGNLGRMGLAISKANSSKVYALIESSKNALYVSEDGGGKFKMINDELGHAAGDMVLKRFADIVSISIRGSDIAARFGGDEFVILLEDATLAEAEIIASRIQTRVAHWADENGMDFSVTFGIGEAPTHGESFNALLEQVDKALYHSKSTHTGGGIAHAGCQDAQA